jgi:hypothetical protein
VISGVEQREKNLFSSTCWINMKDYEMQEQLGFKVTSNNDIQSCPNIVSREPQERLSFVFATRLFSVICGYRLVDAVALITGAHPLSTKVERTEYTGRLPVRVLRIFLSGMTELKA